jgi:hypothetical protein
MPEDALEQLLRLVADGRLTAEEAAPLLDALDARADDASDREHAEGTDPGAFSSGTTSSPDDAPARAIRIVVSDDGRPVVNLRVPLALGRAALDSIPGLTETMTERIRAALATGFKGPIVQVDDEGDGVRIAIE